MAREKGGARVRIKRGKVKGKRRRERRERRGEDLEDLANSYGV